MLKMDPKKKYHIIQGAGLSALPPEIPIAEGQ